MAGGWKAGVALTDAGGTTAGATIHVAGVGSTPPPVVAGAAALGTAETGAT